MNRKIYWISFLMVFSFSVKSLKIPKGRKTIEEQKKLAHEREKKAVEGYGSWEALESDNKNIAIYDDDNNLSLQSLKTDDKLKPRAASRSVSFLLPNLPTAKMVRHLLSLWIVESFIQF
jgi:hypothetical protein